jgi:WD40 repeat protein
VRLWDLPSGRPHQLARIGMRNTEAVAFAPDGRTIATANWKDAQLWDIATGRAVGVPFTGSTDYLLALAFSPDGRQLVTGGADDVPRIFDVAVRQPVGHVVVDTGYLYDLAVAPTGRTLAVAASGQVSVRDRSTGKLLAGPWPTVGGTAVAYSPDGSLLAFGYNRGAVRLRPVAATSVAARDLDTGSDVYTIAFSPDGRTLFAAGFDGVVHSWDVATGRPDPDLKSPDDDGISDLAVDPTGRYVAGAYLNGPVKLWKLPGGRLIASLSRAGDKGSTAVAFAPDGRHLAQGTSEGAVRVWDVQSGTVTCVLKGHKSWVRSAAFSPTGSLLATGADDGSVQLWDPAACTPVGAPMSGFGEAINGLAFAPDGRELLVGSQNGTVHGVAVPDQWLRQACELARRNLSRSEWAQYAVGTYRRTCPQWPTATR